MIEPSDDLLHVGSKSPYWNESAYFSFTIPERELHGLVYFWHRPNLTLTQAGVAVWDPSGSEVHNCIYNEFDYYQPLLAGAEMFDFDADCGLSVKCLEPLASFQLTYQGADCAFEFSWDRIMEPLEAPVVAPEVLDITLEGWGSGHYDQAGRMRGDLIIGGERMAVDCFSNRDRSWGERRMRHDLPRCAYEWGIADERSSFLAHTISLVPPDEDMLGDTAEERIRGWYVKDGVRAELREGQRRVVERHLDGRPLTIVVDGIDDLGRALHTEGRSVSTLRQPLHVFWLNNWSLVKWQFDGEKAWGESQDFVHLRQNRRYVENARKMNAGTIGR